MPSDKKRINLTVPDAIYEQLQAYKAENGLTNDATACLQLIVRQLKAVDENKVFLKFFKEAPMDTLMELSKQGLTFAKEELAKELSE